jgi:hypothetical protein
MVCLDLREARLCDECVRREKKEAELTKLAKADPVVVDQKSLVSPYSAFLGGLSVGLLAGIFLRH